VTALNINLADLPGQTQENTHVVREIYALRRHLWVEDEPSCLKGNDVLPSMDG
jgi:hypothetical protein